MDEKALNYFNRLTERRESIADALDDPALGGIKRILVEKYTDQAHFVYELLQNADDVGATQTRFFLEQDRLVFVHNGTKHFSISDPDAEKDDGSAGTLGDVNSITSVGQSNKTEAQIGKFGIGFKAVFQYTDSPRIYDPEYGFKIERLLVPYLVDDDCEFRKPDETAFVFPFNKSDQPAEKAYKEIKEKLSHLTYPNLFLTNLQEVRYKCGDKEGFYAKKLERSLKVGDVEVEKILVSHNWGSQIIEQDLWLFSRRTDQNLRYSVGFFAKNGGGLRATSLNAFCFFETREITGLNFIIHAPFLLTDSREGVRVGVEHNVNLVDKLSMLAAQALVILRDIGERENVQYIDDSLVDVIPYDREKFANVNNPNKISFYPFYRTIRTKLEKERLIPSTDGCIFADRAIWATSKGLGKIFSNKQLQCILCNTKVGWGFPGISRDSTSRANKPLYEYLKTLVKATCSDLTLLSSNVKSGLSEDFIESQPIEWLHRFYKWLSEETKRTEIARTRPFFLKQHKRAVSPMDYSGRQTLFLPTEESAKEDFLFVHPDLLANKDTCKFLTEKLGVQPPALIDRIYKRLVRYEGKVGGYFDTSDDFRLIFEYYLRHSKTQSEELINKLKTLPVVVAASIDKNIGRRLHIPCSTIFPSESALKILKGISDIVTVDLDWYKRLVATQNQKETLERQRKLPLFFSEIGVKRVLDIETVKVSEYSDGHHYRPHPYRAENPDWPSYCYYMEKQLSYCEAIVKHIVSKNDEERSILLWNELLLKIKQYGSLEWALKSRCEYFYYTDKIESYDSYHVHLLRNEKWLMDNECNFVSANELVQLSICDLYNLSAAEASGLFAFLKIPVTREKIDILSSNLNQKQRELIEFALLIKGLGIESKEDIAALKTMWAKYKSVNNPNVSKEDVSPKFQRALQFMERNALSSKDIDQDEIKSILSIIEEGQKVVPVEGERKEKDRGQIQREEDKNQHVGTNNPTTSPSDPNNTNATVTANNTPSVTITTSLNPVFQIQIATRDESDSINEELTSIKSEFVQGYLKQLADLCSNFRAIDYKRFNFPEPILKILDDFKLFPRGGYPDVNSLISQINYYIDQHKR